jgi:hypothetical protein
MYNFLWPKANQIQALNAKSLKTQSQSKPIKKETCDLCFLKRPINKWYSDDFFICNKCASCEHCNTLDDKIKRELDINEITQICKSCT